MKHLNILKNVFYITFFILISCPNELFSNNPPNQNLKSKLDVIEKIDDLDIESINISVNQLLRSIEKFSNPEKITIYKTIGNKYFQSELYILSLSYFFKEYELVESSTNYSAKSEALNRIGAAYFNLKRFDKAESHFLKSIEQLNKIPEHELNEENTRVYNNYSGILANKNEFNKSLNLLLKRLKFIPINDEKELSKLYQNLFLTYYSINEYQKAKNYLYKSKKIIVDKNYLKEEANLYYNLYLFHCQENNVDSSNFYLNKMYAFSNKNNLTKFLKISSNELATRFEAKNQLDSALFYLKINQKSNENLIAADKNKFLNEQQELHFVKEHEKNLLLKHSRDKYLIIIAILLSFVTIISSVYIIKKYKKRIKKDKFKELKLNEEILLKEQQLKEKSMLLIKKNAIIEESTKKLNSIKEVSKGNVKSDLKSIISDLKNGGKVYNQDEFEILIKENYSDFYKNLITKYPDLTKNEIRMCLFAKLNLSIKEISNITKQSPNSITIARYRLKKKLNIENEDISLNNFILKL